MVQFFDLLCTLLRRSITGKVYVDAGQLLVTVIGGTS